MAQDVRFRQIDFLRLFRLCKDMGIVNRKRKLPTEYFRDIEQKNACKRLLTAVIKSVYKDYRIYIGSHSIIVNMPINVSSQLRTILEEIVYHYSYCSQRVELSEEAIRQINDLINLNEFGYAHINSGFPQNIHFRYFPHNGTMENFYHCALDCINFKKYWDEQIVFILKVYGEAKLKANDHLKETQKKEKEKKLQRQQEELQQQEEEFRELQEKKQQSQQLFNQALSAYLTKQQ